MNNRILFAMILSVLGGCTSLPNAPKPDDPNYAPMEPEEYQASLTPTGSIFSQGAVNSIYSDIKAHRLGDIITVELQESTSASKGASNKQSKTSNLALNALSLGGKNVTMKGYDTSASMGGNNSFNGQASVGQSNSLQGNISVSVVRILSNGNLMVRGEKWLTLTEGQEYIRITGIVRSEDVNSDNTVSSQRIANARIQYGGTGDFANTQERGWLSKFFNGPYSPF